MYQKPDRPFIDYKGYHWGRLNQIYRGPQPDLASPYIACLGSAQTFGRYVEQPFPQLLAETLDMQVANFGTASAGPGFFLRDSLVTEAASKAAVCVIQVMSARSLSNRLFRVELSRNEEIEAVTRALQSLFPHVDFETFTYAHNMLNQLVEDDPESFLAVEAEMKAAWVARTRVLLETVQTKRILFWFSERDPDEEAPTDAEHAMLKYPQFVDKDMIDAVAPLADKVVTCVTSAGIPQSLMKDGEAVLHTPFGMPISENRYYPSPEMHRDACAALAEPVLELMRSGETPAWARRGMTSI